MPYFVTTGPHGCFRLNGENYCEKTPPPTTTITTTPALPAALPPLMQEELIEQIEERAASRTTLSVRAFLPYLILISPYRAPWMCVCMR